jgi:hypothetical protein
MSARLEILVVVIATVVVAASGLLLGLTLAQLAHLAPFWGLVLLVYLTMGSLRRGRARGRDG